MAKTAVILSNIGTPKSPEPRDVGVYLKEFLMDPFVIDKPWWFRTLLVKGIIVPFRKGRSSEAYKKVWTKEGSPLLVFTEALRVKMQEELGEDYKVILGMRYGEPSLKKAFEEAKDCEEVVLFPQFPQYAESSVRTCVEWSQRVGQRKLHVISPFYKEAHFIEAWVKQIQAQLAGFSYDHILFSYHGLPERHLTKIDPTGNHCGNYPSCCEQSEKVVATCYRAQCLKTTQAIVGGLGLAQGQYSFSFQSRLGREPWIPPFTDHVLPKLASEGVKNLAVVCPSFTADCLETLEEIAIGGRETFVESGGQDFKFIPCLNAEPAWVKACAQMVLDRY